MSSEEHLTDGKFNVLLIFPWHFNSPELLFITNIIHSDKTIAMHILMLKVIAM